MHAQHGVLDISDMELEDNNKYLLSGEWEIYDGVLIDPGEIKNYAKIMTYMSSGRNSIDSGSHNRTYQLKILSHDMNEIGILIPDINAYKLWINDSLIIDYRLNNKNSMVQNKNTVLIDQKQYT